jgi:hypothetical protein
MNYVLSDLLGMAAKPGDVGIEVEVEGYDPLPVIAEGAWRSKADNSLRYNGMEYITKSPIRVCNTKIDKIKVLTDKLNKKGIELVKNSPRTSVHVHVNVMRHTPRETWTAIVAYWLLDNLLMKYCGEDYRQGNLFCLGIKDSEATLQYCKQDLAKEVPFNSFREFELGNVVRYSSQNLAALPKYGSLEYRGMRGTTDPELIDEWSTELFNLVERSKRFGSPSVLMDTYFGIRNKDDFLKYLFSEKFVNRLISLPNWQDLIEDNEDLLGEIAYAHNWERWESRVNNYIKDSKEGEKGRGDNPREQPYIQRFAPDLW